jgi:hypothetical protein
MNWITISIFKKLSWAKNIKTTTPEPVPDALTQTA